MTDDRHADRAVRLYLLRQQGEARGQRQPLPLPPPRRRPPSLFANALLVATAIAIGMLLAMVLSSCL